MVAWWNLKNPQGNEWNFLSTTNHEDHIAGEGFTSMSHYNLVHKFIRMPPAMKIPDANAAVDKKWKSSRQSQHDLEKVKRNKKKLHFAALMDICHPELEPKLQKYKSRVVLQGDIVMDDSGAYAVCIEQGSSASQMTAARLPNCDGQAADAAFAYTQEKFQDAPRLLKIPQTECLDAWTRLPRHKWPKSCENIEDPVVPLERNLSGHPSAALFGETIRRRFTRTWMGESSGLGMYVRSLETRKLPTYVCA